MSDETTTEGTVTTASTDEEATTTVGYLAVEPSNSDVKNHPLFQKMTNQLADFQNAEKERKESEAKAKREAEEQKLKDEGRFDELAEKHKADLTAIETRHAKEILDRDLTTELIKTGFQNDMFVKGAVTGYDSEAHGDINAYVAALAADETNKPFLSAPGTRTVHRAAGAVPAGGGSVNWEQVKAAIDSPDRQTRIDARAKVTAHREATGEYPF